MFSEVREKGEGRLGGQRFGILGGLGRHAKEQGDFILQAVVRKGEEVSCSSVSPVSSVTDVLQVHSSSPLRV